MKNHVIATTARLSIREIDKEAALLVTGPVDDVDTTSTYLESKHEDILEEMEKDLDAVKATIKLITALRDTNDVRRYGAWNEADELVAYAGFTSWSTGTPELQITVATGHQGQGYGTEFLSGLLPWLFSHNTIDHFVYRIRPDNIPSENIAIRLGGELQKPSSRIEELIVKTYYIYPQTQTP